jgi:hypothetical protein
MGLVSKILAHEKKFSRIELYPVHRILMVVLVSILGGLCVLLYRNDKRRKTLSIYYTLDGEVESLHQKFLEYFKEFAASRKIWQKLTIQGVSDTKYNAGASQVVTRNSINTISSHRLPTPYLKTNILIPYIGLKHTELFFFPERLILKRGDKYGAVLYRNISVESSNSRFIESEGVPGDATVVDYTWLYLNKSGGPDRRFSDNRQLPICLYTDYEFKSENGMHEVITTSKNGGMDNFVRFLAVIGEYQRRTVIN